MASAPNPYVINGAQRSAVLNNAVLMKQRIASVTTDPKNNPIINIQPRNVGLIVGLLVEVIGNVKNGATDAANRTNYGSANMVSNFTFTDLNNVQRINTTGYHIAMLNAARQGFVMGGAYAPNVPMNYGNHWGPFKAGATVAAGATGEVKHTYHLPLAYSVDDLRGAIYANIVNATMNLQVTLNSKPFVAAGADPLNAIYSGNVAGAWEGGVTINVYQVFYDQIPMDANRNPIIPMIDVSTVYDLKQTTIPGVVQAQDFPVAFANYRQFLSTFVIYNNGGQYNAGTDVNEFALLAANQTQLFRVPPDICALDARQTFMADLPPGTYYFDHRRRPIDTITYGNMELSINAKTVNPTGGSLVMLYEAFQMQGATGMATSLPAGVS